MHTKIGSRLQEMTSPLPIFFVDQYEFMAYQALWIWQVAGSLATWIQVQQGAET